METNLSFFLFFVIMAAILIVGGFLVYCAAAWLIGAVGLPLGLFILALLFVR